MTMYQIPFNRPYIAGNELAYLTEALQSRHWAGDGVFTEKCHTLLEQSLSVPKVLLTTSCTHALEMAALLLDIQPGDEVIIPDFTFVTTANAFVLRGAKPVFADIRTDTLNLDEDKLESLISSHTKAIVVMHYAGVGCEMDPIGAVAKRHNIPVVEDNAHGLFGKYKGKPLGTLGSLSAQSFHETKNFTSGEGGALLINDSQYIERAEIIREKGTDRSKFFRGQVDKYTWSDLGSSYLPSELLAAVLLSQLEAREEIQRKRRNIWENYHSRLQAWTEGNGIRLPLIPSTSEQSYHMYYLLMPSHQNRQDLIAHMKEQGILCVFHYLPLHLSPMGLRMGGKPGDCPISEDVSDRLVRLPFFTGITDDELETVISALSSFSC